MCNATLLGLKSSPSVCRRGAVLFRGGVVALQLISVLRAAKRPKPDPSLPFSAVIEDAEAIYNYVWWFDGLWLFKFYCLLIEYVSGKPGNPLDFVLDWMGLAQKTGRISPISSKLLMDPKMASGYHSRA